MSWKKEKNLNVPEKSWKFFKNTYEIRTEYFCYDLYST